MNIRLPRENENNTFPGSGIKPTAIAYKRCVVFLR